MANYGYRLGLISYFCIRMKIFTSAQIHELDKYTIEHEPISSLNLMERAAHALTRSFEEEWTANTPIIVFAGPGNNGGDALAMSRLLADDGYNVNTYLFNIHSQLSEDCEANKQKLISQNKVKFTEVTLNFDPPVLSEDMVIIDGLFGSGLNKPLGGGFASLVKYINQSPAHVVSIDIPSGLMCEDNTNNIRANIIKAELTLTLQQKKLSMLLMDCQHFIGRIKILDIQLAKEFIQQTDCTYRILEKEDISQLLLERSDFAHKGSMGNAMLIAGSYGMSGAAVLATKACMRSGAGKVTTVIPKLNYNILQISAPEAVLIMDREDATFSQPIETEEYDAVGMGPGIGQQESTAIALIAQIRRTQCPMVLDADALNILGNHRAWMQQLPGGIIMTPHPREFDRLAGTTCNDSYDRLTKARELAEHLQAYIILKGHYSALCFPDGHVEFNPTGNSGMATAGSGDVLTGIITGLLARGYNQADASRLGMYIHGLAGDLAAKEMGKESLIASDIIQYLPKAFKALYKS